ncbi:10970_t:CDS:2, partial [Entrophospora sp. SA101]
FDIRIPEYPSILMSQYNNNEFTSSQIKNYYSSCDCGGLEVILNRLLIVEAGEVAKMGFGCGFPVIVELEVDDEGGVETV